MKIILDMDPGIDDAVALLLALNNPRIEVLAVTAANGNVSVNKSAYNALRIIESLGRKVAVAKGSSRPLFKRPIHAEHVHGSDGLGGSNLPRPRGRASRQHAVTLIENLVKTHRKKELALVATAPLTNIALLFERDPSIAKRFERIALMGGVFGLSRHARGNVTPYAEFNFYCDPEAADAVLNSGADVVVASLDVTTDARCAVRKGMLRKISLQGGRAAETAGKVLSYPVLKDGIFHLHDVFALASLLRPDIFRMVRCTVRVNGSGKFRGRCVTKLDGKGSVRVCSSVDHEKFLRFLLKGLTER